MLNDHDRETLDEIQRGLATEDPQFAVAFDHAVRHLPARRPKLSRTVVTVLLVLALLLTALMIVVHAAGPALFFAVVACGLILQLRRRRER